MLRRTSTTEFTLAPETLVTSAGQISALTTGDFDGDGLTGVVVVTDGPMPNLFLSRGQSHDGILGDVEPLDPNTSYFGAGVVPLFNSTTSRLDLCALLPDPAVRILHNDGSGAFPSPSDLVVPTPSGGLTPTPVTVTTGRFTGVAAPYIACADSANDQIVIFTDFGSGYELASSVIVGNPLIRIVTSIVAADLEADGDDDLVVGFDDGNSITVLTCLGPGSPFSPMALPAGFRPGFVTAGDVDGNGLPDIDHPNKIAT